MVEMPMVSSAATSVALRPMRSPKWPNRAEPTGRAKKAMAKVAKRLQHGRGRVPGREEQLREHQHRGGGVDVEVEEFDGGADQACEQDGRRLVAWMRKNQRHSGSP
jgi:hypothetical protein